MVVPVVAGERAVVVEGAYDGEGSSARSSYALAARCMRT